MLENNPINVVRSVALVTITIGHVACIKYLPNVFSLIRSETKVGGDGIPNEFTPPELIVVLKGILYQV